ncbi:MAG: prepilin-type N-terminal cleavage/methylation domain-containing protein [Phycisphaerales bacterium]|nr:prepilin-type N-terminal cleavage/methylation domain-containing protein [Phycisphaerales bacterium]
MTGERYYKSRCAGAFSLVELVCVVLIIGIIAGLAVPRFANAIARRQSSSAAYRVVQDFALAQHHARITSTNVTLHFDGTTGTYWLDGVPDPDNVSKRYEVHLQDEPYHVASVRAALGGDTELIYDMYGRPDGGGTVRLVIGNIIKSITVNATSGVAKIVELKVADVDVATTGVEVTKGK